MKKKSLSRNMLTLLVSGSQTFLMIFRFSFDYVAAAAVAANMQCA